MAIHLGDTAYGPYAPVSSGSATQATIGPAIQAAAVDARRQLFEAAAPMLEVAAHDLELHDGQVRVKGQPGRQMAISEVLGKISPHMIQGHGSRGPNPSDKTIHTFGVQTAEVEVDTETGEITVLRIVAAHDCGRVVNPMMVESQVIGAVTQGIGFALTEERIIDDGRGFVMNANLEEYKIPTVLDMPGDCVGAAEPAGPRSEPDRREGHWRVAADPDGASHRERCLRRHRCPHLRDAVDQSAGTARPGRGAPRWAGRDSDHESVRVRAGGHHRRRDGTASEGP